MWGEEEAAGGSGGGTGSGPAQRASPAPVLRRARRSAGAATQEWTKQDGWDLSLVLERAVLASAQCHLGRPEEHRGSHLPTGGGPLPRLPGGLLHLHGAAHLREVRRAGAPGSRAHWHTRAHSPAPWRTPPLSGSHLPTFVFTVGVPHPSAGLAFGEPEGVRLARGFPPGRREGAEGSWVAARAPASPASSFQRGQANKGERRSAAGNR